MIMMIMMRRNAFCTHAHSQVSIRRSSRPMAHTKEEIDDAVDEGWLPATNDPYMASPIPKEEERVGEKTGQEKELAWYARAKEEKEEEEEVGPLLPVEIGLDQARVDEPKIPLKKMKKEELGLAKVDEPQEEKALDPKEEPVDPDAAAPARSMRSVPVIWQSSRPASSSSSSYKFVAPRSKAPGVDASRPTGSKSSSDKFVAPSSKAHGDYQGVDASQPTGSQSSSHDASQPAAHKEEKVDAADRWDKEHQRCAALLASNR